MLARHMFRRYEWSRQHASSRIPCTKQSLAAAVAQRVIPTVFNGAVLYAFLGSVSARKALTPCLYFWPRDTAALWFRLILSVFVFAMRSRILFARPSAAAASSLHVCWQQEPGQEASR